MQFIRGRWNPREENPTKNEVVERIVDLDSDGTKSLQLSVPPNTTNINVEVRANALSAQALHMRGG